MKHVRKGTVVAIGTTFLALILLPVPAHGTSFRVARTVQVDYPRRVVCKQDFHVVVTFEYASRVLVDVGILEEETLRVVQSLTLISGFFGPGNVTFVFNLTAPDATCVWRLVAATRAWWADSWFSDPLLGAKAFSVKVASGDTFWLNVTSKHPFQVDGLEYRPSNGQEVGIVLGRGRHTIFADPVRPSSEGVRLVFDRWSDGVRSNPRAINLIRDLTLKAIYRTQYLLRIDSEYGEPTGGGWYDGNTDAWFAVLPEVRTPVLGLLQARYVFDKWEGDWDGQSSVAAIQMNRPKKVVAVWREELVFPLEATIRIMVGSILLASLLLFILGARRRHFEIRGKLNPRALEKHKVLLAVTIWLIVGSMTVLPSSATESPASIKIGETYWRHWQNRESDTCVIWLGGGIQGAPLIINPYWLESYNTMLFVQDLARYYSVLTLERGSSTIYQTALNRTIRAEFYPSRLINDARVWAAERGYSYVYLVGYSVGGIAAAKEATIADPDGWASPNGIVLITVPLEEFLPYAEALKANHLILYGTAMTKSFVESGRSFFESTKDEGQYDDYWLHKEFRVIGDVAHEVWTVAKSGQYDSEAIAVTVDFVELSKNLQLERQKTLLQDASKNVTSLPINTQARVELTEVRAPLRVASGEVYQVSAEIRWRKRTVAQGWIVLYSPEADTVLSTHALPNVESGSTKVALLTRAPNEKKHMRLNLMVLLHDDSWTFPTGNCSITLGIVVSDQVDVVIKTGLPRIQVKVNGVSHMSDDAGLVKVTAVRGYHVVEMPAVSYLTDHERAVFEEWSDGTHSPKRVLRISDSLQIEAFFRVQYRVNVSSELGSVIGDGWYDQNSTATIMLYPPMIRDRVDGILTVHRFNEWSLGAETRNTTLTLSVTMPMEIQAVWSKDTYDEVDIKPYIPEFFVSFLILVISVAFARKSRASTTKR